MGWRPSTRSQSCYFVLTGQKGLRIDHCLTTKVKTPKAGSTVKRVYVQVQIKEKTDFFRTSTMYQPQWQAQFNQAPERLIYKTDCWCIHSSEIELSKVKNILVSWSVHPDHSNKAFMESRYHQNIAGEQGNWEDDHNGQGHLAVIVWGSHQIHVPLLGRSWNHSDVFLLFYYLFLWTPYRTTFT